MRPTAVQSPRKAGWFVIPGVQTGDRTLAEQMEGLGAALSAAHGRTVCDLGCAEGLIAMEFAKAGARSVYACDFNGGMIETARALAAHLPGDVVRPTFCHADVRDMIERRRSSGDRVRYDVVLALAIVHKFEEPADAVEFVADLCGGLAVIRLPRDCDSVVKGKRSGRPCDVNAVMVAQGFALECTAAGPRQEAVQYWRRVG